MRGTFLASETSIDGRLKRVGPFLPLAGGLLVRLCQRDGDGGGVFMVFCLPVLWQELRVQGVEEHAAIKTMQTTRHWGGVHL